MASCRYTHKVRVGNWSEDWELEQERLKSFLRKKETRSLAITQTQAKLSTNLQPAELISAVNDGAVHFGDIVMVYSENTRGFLAVDMGESIHHNEGEAYSTSFTLNEGPYSRNTWRITALQGSGIQDGDALTYGQEFQLVANPDLSSDPLYLHSQMVSLTSAAKLTRFQEVVVTKRNNFATVWKVLSTDRKSRFEAEGTPVGCGNPVVIQHGKTAQMLSCENVTFQNDFGPEFEACCKTHVDQYQLETQHNRFTFITQSLFAAGADSAQ
eukprot:TRINITY_DN20_c0_g1_i1.p1 TRINITY_DN20_c0_g1~~TRINITY_DN20_c0_g1_i1.p1  ORF type:complete len:269 (-),score=43.15 TRINITY_DN20_c0_g1_i1:179-985(-)